MDTEGQVYQGNTNEQPPQPPQDVESSKVTKSNPTQMSEDRAVNRLMSLGIILLSITMAITLLYFFSTSETLQELNTSFRQLIFPTN